MSSEIESKPAPQSSNMSPIRAAKFQAHQEEFQRKQAEFMKSIKEYVVAHKDEEHTSTDEESEAFRRWDHNLGSSKPSALDCLGQQVQDVSDGSSRFPQPVARIPSDRTSASMHVISGKFSGNDRGAGSGYDAEKVSPMQNRSSLFSDEDNRQVRFVSARLPATGSAACGQGSPSFDSANLKPILKKRAGRSPQARSSCSSSDQSGELNSPVSRGNDQGIVSNQKTVNAQDSRYTTGHHPNVAMGNSRIQNQTREYLAVRDVLTSPPRDCAGTSAEMSSSLTGRPNGTSASPNSSLTEGSTDCSRVDGNSFEANSQDESRALHGNARCSPTRVTQAHPGATKQSSPILPSQVLSPQTSPASDTTQRTFVDGVLIQSEGAPAPRPFTLLENSPFADYSSRLGIVRPSPIQSHSWPAVLRGRDVIGVSPPNSGEMLAYLLPIVVHVMEEKDVYSELPLGNGVSRNHFYSPVTAADAAFEKQNNNKTEKKTNQK